MRLPLLCALFCTAIAQLSLPLIPSPHYASLPGEELASRQLSTWGIHLGPISLPLDLGVSPRAANAVQAVDDPLQCNSGQAPLRRSRERSLLGNLGLASILKLDNSSFDAGATVLEPVDDGEPPLGVGLGASRGVGLQAKVQAGELKWGEADTVAKGSGGDTEWFTYLSIGTPPQSIPLLPDSGSSDLWVFGSSCQGCDLSNHTSFASTSSSYINYSTTWEAVYGDGDGASGIVGSDFVHLGNLAPLRTPFALANHVSGRGWAKSPHSGIIGLAQDALSTLQVPSSISAGGLTLFSRLVKAGELGENVLSIRLEQGAQAQGVVTEEGGGAFTFGVVEDSYILGGRAWLGWVDVTSSIYWGFGLGDISYGPLSILNGDSASRRAIIDTGTTLIITSDQVSRALHTRIDGSFQDSHTGMWYIPCGTSYPASQNVFFTIGAIRYGVPVQDLAWKASATSPGYCISGIQGGMPHFTVLGTMFIKNHYVVLSYGAQEDGLQVGIGARSDLPPVL